MAKSSKTVHAAETEVTAPALTQSVVEVVTQPEVVVSQPIVTAVAPAVQPNVLTSEQDQHIRAMKTKSEQMRYLSSLGWKNGPIAKYLTQVYNKTVIYQHVRNVLRQPLKKQ
jgi:hypothetical protein